MSRTAPSRFAFSPRSTAAAFLLALTIVLGACSQSDSAAQPPQEPATSSVAPASPVESTSTPEPPATDTTTTDVPTAVERADLDGVGGDIARRTESGAIVISAPDGTNEREAASGDSTLNSQPTWSNSGDRLAWSSVSIDGAQLAIANVAEDSVTTITSEPQASPAFYLSWSDNDSWISGLRNGATGIELTFADAATTAVRVAGPGQPFFTDWLDDDQLIAAIGGTILTDVPAADENPAVRNIAERLGAFQAPIALPDGDVIVAVIRDNENVVVRLNGNETAPLATADGPVSMATNSDGTRLAIFVGGTGTQSQVINFQLEDVPTLATGRLSIVDLDTNEVETRPEMRVAAMNWSPDGETLAVLRVDDTDLTWLFITEDSVVEGTPFVPSQEFFSSYLPFADQYERSTTWWSPDSTAMVFSGSVDGQAGVWVDRVDDNAPARWIGDGDIAFWSPR